MTGKTEQTKTLEKQVTPLISGLPAARIAEFMKNGTYPKGVSIVPNERLRGDIPDWLRDIRTNTAKLVVQTYDRNSNGNDNVE
jgi:hypothetical protein